MPIKMNDAWLLRVPYGAMSRLRVMCYRSLGMTIGPRCRLENIRVRRPSQINLGANNSLTEGCWLWPVDADYRGYRIVVGEGNYFNRDVMIDACGSIRIGDHNMFGPGVYITDANHTMAPGRQVGDSPMDIGEVVIGDGCWIGAGAKILKGVRLRNRCIVGAGAVVTKSFPEGSVIAGVPARMIPGNEFGVETMRIGNA